MKLRDYQADALNSSAGYFFGPDKIYRQLGVLPTGTGKTVVFSHLNKQVEIAKWLETFPQHQRKVLVIAHREELLDQAAEKIAHANPDLIVQVEQAQRHATPMADVVVASVQTIGNIRGKRMGKFDPDDFRLVIVDEAHHAIASTYVRVLQWLGFLPPEEFMQPDAKAESKEQALYYQRSRLGLWDAKHRPDRLLLGVTATPKRGDNVGLESIFQSIVFSRNLREMIQAGYLAKLRALRIESDTNLDDVKSRAGDFAVDELVAAIDNNARNKVAVKAWLDHASDRQTVVFCANVEHSVHMSEAFREAGAKAAVVHGGMEKEERRQVLKDFKTGVYSVITNCQILTEGWDDPNVSCIIHARPTQSTLLYQQMTGRGTRLAEGKEDCLILDIVDVTRRHALVTAPDLIGLPAGFNAKGGDLVDIVKRIETLKEQNPFAMLSDATSLEDIEMRVERVDLFSCEDNTVIKENARLSWIQDGGMFSISWAAGHGQDRTNERLELRQNTLGQWQAHFFEGYNKPEAVTQPTSDVSTAFRKAEQWVEAFRPDVTNLKNQDARWRTAQASEAQINYLKRMARNLDPAQLQKLTKGQASDMISFYDTRTRSKLASMGKSA